MSLFDPAASLGLVLRQTGETSFLCFGGVSDGRWVRGGGPTPHTPDSGGAQAGGASPPFTVCVRSLFEVFGVKFGGVGRAWFRPALARENQPPVESQLPPFLQRLVYSRYNRTSRRLSFGVYRYFAGSDSEYWHGALKKNVLGWRLAFTFFFSPRPKPCTLVRS